MVLLEEFKDKVWPHIRSHLDEQKVEELEKAAIMADDYALTHKMSSKYGNPQQKRYHDLHLVNIVVNLTIKMRIVELLIISYKKKLNQQG